VQSIYISEQYAESNPTWHEEDSPWKARQIEEIVRKNNLQPDSLLEVGCGTGEILLNLAKSFPKTQFAGYDISPHAYERAKLKEGPRVKFNLGNPIAESNSKYDVVVIADVIEHVEDYISFVSGVRMLGHYKIFHIPLDLSVQSILRSWPIMDLRKNVGHLHYFFKETAIATLKDCGYSIIDYKYTASRLELPNQAFSSQVMRLPRRLLFSLNPDFAVRVLGGYSLLVLAE
jgi:cyclopropane fatty-acyl-phospholipid synthase-like methyltransferase